MAASVETTDEPARGPNAPRVLVVSGSVGAGHDGAARELAARLDAAGAVVEVRDFLAALPRPASWLLREGYLSTVERIPAAFEFLYQHLERKGAFRRADADYGVECTVAGPLVPERYSARPDPARLAALRAELGLPCGSPVALLGGGSLGLGDVAETARILTRSGATALVLCARNERL